MTQEAEEFLGSYYGSTLTLQDCEILTVQNLRLKDRERETALMQTKWFDYRYLHPMKATYLCADAYKTAYKSFMRIAYDETYAKGIKRIFTVNKISKRDGVTKLKGKESVEDFLLSRTWLSFWHMRQNIDELGVPYEFFMSQAVKWHTEQCWRTQTILPPRPGQMMANENMLAEIMISWGAECESRIQFARAPQYKISNFAGEKSQLDYERFIISQIDNRQQKRFSLCDALYKYDAIRMVTALDHFGEQLVSDALSESIYLIR